MQLPGGGQTTFTMEGGSNNTVQLPNGQIVQAQQIGEPIPLQSTSGATIDGQNIQLIQLPNGCLLLLLLL